MKLLQRRVTFDLFSYEKQRMYNSEDVIEEDINRPLKLFPFLLQEKIKDFDHEIFLLVPFFFYKELALAQVVYVNSV